MNLVYLPANQAWTFVFGNGIIALHESPRFFATKAAACQAAVARGLWICADNSVVPA